MSDGAAGLMTALPVFVMGMGALSAARCAACWASAWACCWAGRDRHRRRRPAGGGSYRRAVGHRRRGRPGHRHRAGPVAGLHQGTPRGCQQRRDGALFDRHHGRRGHRQRRHAADGAPTVAVPVAGGLGRARPGRAGLLARAAAPRPSRMPQAPTARTGAAPGCWPFLRPGHGRLHAGAGLAAAHYTALGWTPVAAGSLLGAVTVAEIAAGLLVSALIGRRPTAARRCIWRSVRCWSAWRAGHRAAGLPGRPPCWRAWASAPSSVVADRDHGPRGHARAGRLAAFVQGVGYLIAATFPYAAG